MAAVHGTSKGVQRSPASFSAILNQNSLEMPTCVDHDADVVLQQWDQLCAEVTHEVTWGHECTAGHSTAQHGRHVDVYFVYTKYTSSRPGADKTTQWLCSGAFG
jgi:hypothetical protein